MDEEYTITISPAINIDVRHQIQNVLEASGLYEVTGAGMNFINNTMDISFIEIHTQDVVENEE